MLALSQSLIYHNLLPLGSLDSLHCWPDEREEVVPSLCILKIERSLWERDRLFDGDSHVGR